ncbi:MAG TPA: amidohydrolase family protein, partial [Patescibacteria group bacterium]|nr:amidohydrolase family protein [Patescibacteria group bacterium]
KQNGQLVHPRCFGTAPRFLQLALRRDSAGLENAIKKLSFQPAQKLGLKRRGSIKVGNFADLVLFDPKNFRDYSTYENPYQYSRGLDYVFVNGRPAVENGQLTQAMPGRVLRKE